MAQNIKTVQGITLANTKTIQGIAIANIKTIQGIDNTGGGQTLVKFEDFQTAGAGANNLTAITGWTAMEGGVGTNDIFGKFAFPNTSASYGSYYWNTGTSSLNQRSECTIVAVSAGEYFGPAVRMQTGATSFYGLYVNNGDISLQKRIAGTSTQIATDATDLTVGDMVAIEVSGSGAATRLAVQIDTGGGWTTVISNIDPGDYLGSGKAGIASFGQSSIVGLDDWFWYDI